MLRTTRYTSYTDDDSDFPLRFIHSNGAIRICYDQEDLDECWGVESKVDIAMGIAVLFAFLVAVVIGMVLFLQ